MPINRTDLAGRHNLLHLELQLLNPDANGKFTGGRLEHRHARWDLVMDEHRPGASEFPASNQESGSDGDASGSKLMF
jgi:hypothetical protein